MHVFLITTSRDSITLQMKKWRGDFSNNIDIEEHKKFQQCMEDKKRRKKKKEEGSILMDDTQWKNLSPRANHGGVATQG